MNIIALANTIVFENLVSGGDVILPQIKKYWDKRYNFDLITSSHGRRLWLNLGVEANSHLLKGDIFEKKERFFLIPFTYLIRTFSAYFVLKRLLGLRKEGKVFVYSCSDFFPDVLPVFLAKFKYKNVIWLSRIYHIILPPWRRKGNFIFNGLSYYAQRFSFLLIKMKADLIIPLQSTDEELAEMGWDKARFFVSNAGIDLELIDSVPAEQPEYDSIYVGTLTYTKGIYDLLDIWKKVILTKPEAKLAIVGGGSDYDITKYRQTILKENLSRNIHYLGFLPRNIDVYRLMKKSKIFVYAGHESGWSLTMAEAMACKIPVVVYDLSFVGTAFKSGYLSVPLYDKENFAKQILYLLDNPQKREEIARQGYIESRAFGWDKVAKKLSEKLESL